MPHNNDTFCPAPFMAVDMESHDVLLPCCAYIPKLAGPDSVKPVYKFKEWWSETLTPLREDLLAGRKNPGCERCHKNEQDGIVSQRQSIMRAWPQYADIKEPLPAPVSIMAGIGTHCNLTCIFCSPHKSSAWAQQYEKNQAKFNNQTIFFDNYPRGAWQKEEAAEEILAELFKTVEEIQFVGGEPLLTPIHLRTLNSVPDPSKVRLKINTSLESLSDAWLETIAKFKESMMLVSVEAVGPLNDYIRAGSKWETVKANIMKLKQLPNVEIYISHVLSRTSVWCLPDVMEFVKEQDLMLMWHRLFAPEQLHISSAPVEQRQTLLNAAAQDIRWVWPPFDQLVSYVEQLPYDPALDTRFWQYIDLQDQLQGRNFRAMLEQYAKA